MTNSTTIVADSDVLVADLLVGGTARTALSAIREHSWLTLVASEPLLEQSETVIETHATAELAADWRALIEDGTQLADHRPGDHPALAAAYDSSAAHVLTFDEQLLTASTARSLQRRLNCSVKPPDGFVQLFDPEALYEHAFEESYPGPDERATEW